MKHNVINNIRIDMDQERVRSIVSVRQGDTNTRVIHITLHNSGKIYDLSDVLVAVMLITKPDGNILYNDCVIEGSEIQYTITSQTINVLGQCDCQVQLAFNDGSIVTSPNFWIQVYSKVLNEDVVESQNEYTSILEQVVKVYDYSIKAQNASEQAESSKEASDASAANALVFEKNAKESAANALASECSAGTSASNALTSENHARVSEQSAEDSAASALVSMNASADSASNAEQSESNAGNSKREAETRAQEAVAAAGTAVEYAGIAKNKAGEAYDSAACAEDFYNKLVETGTLTLGTEHGKAFYGDWGNEAYLHSKKDGNPHKTTAAQVGADSAGTAQSYYENANGYTDQKIADLINGAPSTLDTLGEIAAAMEENEDVVQALDAAIGLKANQAELDTHENNETIHVTATDKTLWNAYEARISALELKINALGYPYTPT